MNPDSPGFPVPRNLHARVREAIARDKVIEPPARWRSVFAMTMALLLTAVLVFFASELVYGRWAAGLTYAIHSVPDMVINGVARVALVVVSVIVVLRRGRSGLGPGFLTLVSIAVLVPVIHAALVLSIPVHETATVPAAVA